MSIFICNVIPQCFVQRNNVSQASNLFCMRIAHMDYFHKIVSIPPITVAESLVYEVNGKIIYAQFRRIRHKSIGRYINALVETFMLLKLCNSKHIWFYNLNNQNLLSYLILRYFTKKRVYILLADFTPANRFFSLQKLIGILISKSHGLLSLSGRTSFKHINFASIPGIIDNLPLIAPNTMKEIRKDAFFFSGYLGLVTGLDLILKFFSVRPNLLLYISGRGEWEETVIKYANEYSNIRYLGFLDYNEYIETLNKIDICLNFRNPELPENLNNFPSKVLEYFSFNKIVISTINYPELDCFKYFSIEYNQESFEKLIIKISAMDNDEIASYMNHQEILRSNFSTTTWKKAFFQLESYYTNGT